jgi:cytochrome P450
MFGADCEDLKLKQTIDGKDQWVNLGEVVIQLLEKSTTRMFQVHNMIFPELLPYYISSSDKELAKNQDQMRDYLRELIR